MVWRYLAAMKRLNYLSLHGIDDNGQWPFRIAGQLIRRRLAGIGIIQPMPRHRGRIFGCGMCRYLGDIRYHRREPDFEIRPPRARCYQDDARWYKQTRDARDFLR